MADQVTVVTFANTVNLTMGITERKQRQQREIKEEIIRCSRRIVEEEGWGNLSVRKIAEAIEYSVPVVYRHFENKEAIIAHFVQEGFSKLNNEVNRAITPQSDPASQIKELANAYWLFAAQNAKFYQVMFGLGVPTCDSVRHSRPIQELSDTMRQLIRAVIKKSGKDVDEHLKLQTLWSILHGIVAVDLLPFEDRSDVCPSAVFDDAITGYVCSFST